jgi:hypothetical protein
MAPLKGTKLLTGDDVGKKYRWASVNQVIGNTRRNTKKRMPKISQMNL